MGNFSSQPVTTASTDYAAIKEQFKSLANIISQYPRLQVRIMHTQAIDHPHICRVPLPMAVTALLHA